MTDYEAEHNLTAHSTSTIKQTARRRPSLTTFYSSLRSLETPATGATQHSHSVPLPVNVEASFVLLAEALTSQQADAGPEQDADAIDGMLEFLRTQASDPPETVSGVTDEFLEGLERVPRKQYGDGSCPICGDKFTVDPHPLVVVLPCHADHKFDYECIRPWLKLNPTCPLDRKNLVKKKEVPKPKPVDDDEEEYDDYFA